MKKTVNLQIEKFRELLDEIFANNPGKQEIVYSKKALGNIYKTYESLATELSDEFIIYSIKDYDITKVLIRKEVNLSYLHQQSSKDMKDEQQL